MVYQERISIETNGHRDAHDLTDQVAQIVAHSGITTGLVHLFNVGSTGAVGAMEFEPGLESDFPEMLDRLIPPNPQYGHERAWNDGNGQASPDGAFPDGAHRWRPACSGNLAADLSPRVRYQAATAGSGGHRHGEIGRGLVDPAPFRTLVHVTYGSNPCSYV